MDGAGVSVLVLDEDGQERAAELAAMVRRRGRQAELIELEPAGTNVSVGTELMRAARRAGLPIVLVSRAKSAWREADVEALLKALNRADHAVWTASSGGRAAGLAVAKAATLAGADGGTCERPSQPVPCPQAGEAGGDSLAVGLGLRGGGTAGEGDLPGAPDRRGGGRAAGAAPRAGQDAETCSPCSNIPSSSVQMN